MSWKWFACLTAVLGAGCPSADVDPNEVGPAGPTVEFDPANKIIPFPNNLLLDAMTGKLALPATCNPNGGNESAAAKAIREGVLNQLDGFGTWKTTINVTFTEAVDVASLEGKVHLYQIAAAGTAVNPADSDDIPVVAIPNITARFDASCANPKMVNQVTFVPRVPLAGQATYVLGITEGVKTMAGGNFTPSFVWALVRSTEDPVTLDAGGKVVADLTPLDPADPEDEATLKGIDLLWSVHEKPLKFLAAKGHSHATVLIATSFNTQTTSDPLDPTVAGSPAAVAANTPALAGVNRVNVNLNGEQFLNAVLPAGTCGNNPGQLPCDQVAEVLAGGVVSKQYQTDTPNPFDAAKPIPGPWSDPLKPTVVHDNAILGAIITVSKNCPVNGCPTVVFGHGLTGSKTNVFAIAAQLAKVGFNTVAMDWVAHDSRAVRISNDATRGCADVGGNPPSPSAAPQCYAPILSANLATTRDNIRQSIVDLHALVAAVKACAAGCNQFTPDPTKTHYLGISLGGILGGLANATQNDLKTAVLNVPAVSWLDILENTDTVALQCQLVDGLIDAGILVGDKIGGAAPLCLDPQQKWKTQPGYIQFSAIGRWVLDSADAVNFMPQLAAKRVLIQEVVNDTVVPNEATMIEAALLQLQGVDADPAVPPIAASAAITTNPTTNKFVTYPTLPPNGAFPGNTFAHASLLRPANAGADGALGTGRLQTDALTFLVLNNN